MLFGSLCESIFKESHPILGDIRDELIIEVVGRAVEMTIMILIEPANKSHGSWNMQ